MKFNIKSFQTEGKSHFKIIERVQMKLHNKSDLKRIKITSMNK